MPFGKFRNWPLDELPDDYLAWLTSLRTLRKPLRAGVKLEWHRRLNGNGTVTAGRPDALYVAPGDRGLFGELVEAGYRAVAKKLHPDHGGDNREMQRLTGLMSELRSQLKS